MKNSRPVEATSRTDSTLRAVLFDMDGTLLDSERLWDVALHDVVAQLGGTLSPAVRESMLGASMPTTIGIIHDALRLESDPADTNALLTQRAGELFVDGLEWRPGARQLIDSVRSAGLPTAVVTSTKRELTDVALDWMGRELFDVSVCGDEVQRPKPDPESYLVAAAALGEHPDHCAAVEDSPTGVSAAAAAGCAVLAVPDGAAVPVRPNVTVVRSLVGVDVATLRELVAALNPRG